MIQLRRLTLALPVALMVAGLAVPVVVDGGSSRPPAPPEEPRYAGRSAGEWLSLGLTALEKGRLNAALKYLKTAERVEPGSQYAEELSRVRAARRTARVVSRNRRRLLEGEPAAAEISRNGEVVSAHRVTVALPGESLWSLAVELIAARNGVAPSDVTNTEEIYSAWDSLTEINGLRELAVGETVRLPMDESELKALSIAHAEDLERVRLALDVIGEGDLERALELRGEVEAEFVLASDAVSELDGFIRRAQEEAERLTVADDGTTPVRKPDTGREPR